MKLKFGAKDFTMGPWLKEQKGKPDLYIYISGNPLAAFGLTRVGMCSFTPLHSQGLALAGACVNPSDVCSFTPPHSQGLALAGAWVNPITFAHSHLLIHRGSASSEPE